jgi:hypothetical protein
MRRSGAGGGYRCRPFFHRRSGVFLAVALLAAVVISLKLTERKDDVLHGSNIKREDEKE